jgi:mRNA-degrading endonuclease RelE of RelBE toxin-antitoxin system
MPYELGFTELGQSSLRAVEKNVRREIFREILSLADQPKAGKSLIGPLLGLYSLRVRNRYRVVYRIDEEAERVYVELVGERKPGREDDIYQAARRLLENLKG